MGRVQGVSQRQQKEWRNVNGAQNENGEQNILDSIASEVGKIGRME